MLYNKSIDYLIAKFINYFHFEGNTQGGFSAVETLVTLVVASIFVFGFFQLQNVISTQNTNTAQRTIATDYAYSKLKPYSVRPAELTCTTSTNLKTNNSAPGYVFTLAPDTVQPNLPKNISVTLKGFFPVGCTATSKSVVMLRAEVTYGPKNTKVVQAVYLPYE